MQHCLKSVYTRLEDTIYGFYILPVQKYGSRESAPVVLASAVI